jgi:hypothetical protein
MSSFADNRSKPNSNPKDEPAKLLTLSEKPAKVASAAHHREITGLCHSGPQRESTGAPGSPQRTPDFLSSLLALANFMRLSLMKAAHAGVGGAPCRKFGYVGRKRWAKPHNRFCSIGNDNRIDPYH